MIIVGFRCVPVLAVVTGSYVENVDKEISRNRWTFFTLETTIDAQICLIRSSYKLLFEQNISRVHITIHHPRLTNKPSLVNPYLLMLFEIHLKKIPTTFLKFRLTE